MKTSPAFPCADVTVGVGGDRDEVAGTDSDLFVVDHDYPSSTQDGVGVLDAVVTMVVSNRLRASRKLDLVEPEGADAEFVTDAFVELAGCGMSSGAGGHLRCVAQFICHAGSLREPLRLLLRRESSDQQRVDRAVAASTCIPSPSA
jgi:hypothetical protein